MVPVKPRRFVRSDYHGSLLAPYRRFRSNEFYSSFVPGGTVGAEIQGCPWRCQGCWSRYGWSEEKVTRELMPDEVVSRVLALMDRSGKGGGRLCGGDAAYWWDHVHEVVRLFVEQTKGERIVIPGLTRHGGAPMQLVVETSGGIGRFAEHCLSLEAELGSEAGRVAISIGMKASDPQRLARLTGMAPAAAAAAHRRQMELFDVLTDRCEHLQYVVTFLDRYTDESAIGEIEDRALASGRGGTTVFPLRTYR